MAKEMNHAVNQPTACDECRTAQAHAKSGKKNIEDPKVIAARRHEIADACAALYERSGLNGVNIKAIAELTSMSRPSVYNYFSTIEDIILFMLGRQLLEWDFELYMTLGGSEEPELSKADLADALAVTLGTRKMMLKLISMNLSEVEAKCSPECLDEFNKIYGCVIRNLRRYLARIRPSMKQENIDGFVTAFMPFMHGVFPIACKSDAQKKAMQDAKVEYPILGLAGTIQAAAYQILGD